MTTAISVVLGLSAPSGQGQSGGFLFVVPYILIFVVFYFLLIAPARKKQRLHQEMLKNLKAGTKVITNGGILGTVVGVTDEVVQLRVADQVKIEISKNAVAALQNPTE